MTTNFNEYIQQSKNNSKNIHNWRFSATRFEEADERWQKFYRECRGIEPQNNDNGRFWFPMTHDAFRPRKCYDDLYSKVWTWTMEGDRQILITGQPGTGKRVAMWYLIYRVIRETDLQPIVYVARQTTYVFYNGKVFFGPTNACASDALPSPKAEPATLLAFLNLDTTSASFLSVGNASTRLIQASSPNPKNHPWTKKDLLHIQLVLPLWTKSELVESFEMGSSYTRFVDTLHESFDEHGNAKEGVDPDFASRFKSALEQARLQADTHLGPLDRTLKLSVLIGAAMAKFGSVARDVFAALLDPLSVDAEVDTAVDKLTLDDLLTASIDVLSLPGISHRIILASAEGEQIDKVMVDPKLRITIKSPNIANRAMGRLQAFEDKEIVQTCVRLLFGSCGRPLAGWVFKDVAPRFLKTSQNDIPLVPMVPTDSKTTSNPTFTTPKDLKVGNTVLPSKLKVEKISFKSSNWKNVPRDIYLFSDVCNTPLMDSILIQTKGRTFILWVLQLAVAEGCHYGSKEGYPLIDEIKQSLLSKPNHTVQTRYVLIKPTYSDYSFGAKAPAFWKMPEGWIQRKGVVFCAYLRLQ
ncbi:hypothetical protein E1B28_002688 [Marasmius oreades]|uniref:Uncharacterized protein n=1 Tax=Marasmius oreades TaxID=181124 RepID=A0A9P7RN88_9AGAR|nr:uncharacterized protein E1B28_002688 [Marasmius oreades]KAG7086756.1 hypothetical protein E1B28_002688 [Marasmius oreades]